MSSSALVPCLPPHQAAVAVFPATPPPPDVQARSLPPIPVPDIAISGVDAASTWSLKMAKMYGLACPSAQRFSLSVLEGRDIFEDGLLRNGTPKAYLEFFLGTTRLDQKRGAQATKSSSPRFNTSISCLLQPAQLDDVIEIRIFSRKLLSNTHLGTVSIRPSTAAQNVDVDEWEPIKRSKKGRPTDNGELHVQYRIGSVAAADFVFVHPTGITSKNFSALEPNGTLAFQTVGKLMSAGVHLQDKHGQTVALIAGRMGAKSHLTIVDVYLPGQSRSFATITPIAVGNEMNPNYEYVIEVATGDQFMAVPASGRCSVHRQQRVIATLKPRAPNTMRIKIVPGEHLALLLSVLFAVGRCERIRHKALLQYRFLNSGWDESMAGTPYAGEWSTNEFLGSDFGGGRDGASASDWGAGEAGNCDWSSPNNSWGGTSADWYKYNEVNHVPDSYWEEPPVG